MSNYKEIVTKTIIGKGKKSYISTYNIEPDIRPNTVLGCWIINHKFNGTNKNNEVVVNGSFDVNIWYSHDNDSKTSVYTKNLTYTETMKLKLKNQDNLDDSEIIVRSLSQPTVQNVKINDNIIELTINKELGVEIVGEDKVKIATVEDELPWDEIYEEPDLNNIEENYISENK